MALDYEIIWFFICILISFEDMRKFVINYNLIIYFYPKFK